MSKKEKPRWKELPFYERLARECKRDGRSEFVVNYFRERNKQKEKEN